MNQFNPVFNAGGASVQVRSFVKDHMRELWTIFKPLMLYIAGLYLLDAVISDAFFLESEKQFGFFSLFSSYFTMVLVISWHRVVIHGVDDYVPMNPLKPRKSELVFIGFGIMLGVIAFCVAFIAAFLAAFMGGGLFWIPVVIIMIIAVYFCYRLCLYFPAKATNADITLKQAWGLSKGLLWKIFVASFFASWRVMLVLIGFVVILVILLAALFYVLPLDNVANTVGFILSIPITFYFEPFLTVLGVTVISNYYLYALEQQEKKL